MKILQYIVIVAGSAFVLFMAFTGSEFWRPAEDIPDGPKYYAADPNDPDGEPIEVSEPLKSYAYDFPDLGDQDYTKEAITNAITTNISAGNDLVEGLLYEQLATLEFQDGNIQEARNAYLAGLNLYIKNNKKLRAAELLSSLAHLEVSVENYGEAKEYYQKSAVFYRELNDTAHSDFTLKVSARLP